MWKKNIFSILVQTYAIGITALALYVFYTLDPALRVSLRDAILLPKTAAILVPGMETNKMNNKISDSNNGINTCDASITSNANTHPLDGFNKNELKIASNIIDNEFKNGKELYLHGYWPVYPEKSKVLQYLNNKSKNKVNPFSKIFGADISYINNNKNIREYYYIEIDVTIGKLSNKSVIDGKKGFPMSTLGDVEKLTEIVMNDKQVLGYFTDILGISKTNFKNILCIPTTPIREYLNLMDSINITHRYSFALCLDNTYTIEYRFQNQIPIIPIVDLDEEKLYDFYTCNDFGIECVHHNEYKASTLFSWTDVTTKETMPSDIKMSHLPKCQQERFNNKFSDIYKRSKIEYNVLPNDRLFEINNDHNIKWSGWTFHESFNIRFGAVLSDIRYNNRRIAYNLYLSDIYVPYQYNDASIWWYSKNYLDGSQYGAGWMISTNGFNNKLNKKDCPNNAHWFKSDILLQDNKEYFNDLYYACIFERYNGNPRARHAEVFFTDDKPTTVSYIELVYRFTLTVGHYDYLVDIAFDYGGNIKVTAGAHGYDQIMAINNKFNNKACGYLSGDFCAVTHDHFFSFRIDMDVDTTKNTFYKGEHKKDKKDLKTEWIKTLKTRQRRGQSNNKEGIKINSHRMTPNLMSHGWYYNEIPIHKELDSRLIKNPKQPTSWVFRSNIKNKFGIGTGYEIYPFGQDININNVTHDIRHVAATWSNYGIQVTKYNNEEFYSSGKYTWQGKGYQGLFEYTSNNDDILNEDLVAWVTLGFHHVTKPEDAPLLIGKRRTFIIEPNHFFNYSQASCGDDI